MNQIALSSSLHSPAGTDSLTVRRSIVSDSESGTLLPALAVPRMLHNSPARLYLLPPQVAQILCQHAQPEPYLVGPESMATESRHLHCLPLFVDLGAFPTKASAWKMARRVAKGGISLCGVPPASLA